jgi:hypothetical protein
VAVKPSLPPVVRVRAAPLPQIDSDNDDDNFEVAMKSVSYADANAEKPPDRSRC